MDHVKLSVSNMMPDIRALSLYCSFQREPLVVYHLDCALEDRTQACMTSWPGAVQS